MPEQQLVEIARALGADARILILDEPTASLSDREVERLLDVIRELRRQGVGIIYISHRLEELFQVADRVTVLRDGASVGTRPINEVDTRELIRTDGRSRNHRDFSQANRAARRRGAATCTMWAAGNRACTASALKCGPAKLSAWQGWSARAAPSWRAFCSV